MWCGGAYNDGNGCGGAAQVQYFPMHALKLPLQLIRVGGRGIHNVIAREVRCIKILSENFEKHFKKFRVNF